GDDRRLQRDIRDHVLQQEHHDIRDQQSPHPGRHAEAAETAEGRTSVRHLIVLARASARTPSFTYRKTVLDPAAARVFLQPELADALAHFRELHPGRCRPLGEERRGGHPGQRVRLQAPEGILVIQPEIHAAVAAQLERTVSLEREHLYRDYLRPGQVGREDLLRHARLVLALVVVDLVLRYDLVHQQRCLAMYRDVQLTTGDETLDHHLVFVADPLFHGRLVILRILDHREADRRALLARLHDRGPADD